MATLKELFSRTEETHFLLKTPTAVETHAQTNKQIESANKIENAVKAIKKARKIMSSGKAVRVKVVINKWGIPSFVEHIEIERNGINAADFIETIQELKLPNSKVLEFLGIPKSTAAYKIKAGAQFEGTEALAGLRLLKLLAKARSITLNSLHPDSKEFDSGKWLGEWLESPQPALGGIKPSELLDTEVGGNRVYQVLSALESGSYQ